MITDATATYTDEDKAALQKRVVPVLMSGQIVGSAAMGTAVTVGANVVQNMLGNETVWSGVATATVTLGTALWSQILSSRMRRSGRRPGMVYGYTAGVFGGAFAFVGVQADSLLIFVFGLFIFGSGQAANLLARYAAVDLQVPEKRSTTMSLVVFSSTFGAVFGPLLVKPIDTYSQDWFGLHEYAGPWLFSALLYAAASVNTYLRLRPDPLVVAGGVSAAGEQRDIVGEFTRSMRLVALNSNTKLAVSSMVISHVTMVAVMTMTPVHLKIHDHKDWSPWVIALHISGMYALAPLVGKWVDRTSKPKAMAIGAGVLVAATAAAALAGDHHVLLFPSLWLLGLGWNVGLLAGSSLLTNSVPTEDRVMVQGSADLLMSLCGGTAGLASGFIRRATNFHILSAMAMAAAGALLVYAFVRELAARTPQVTQPAH